MDEFIDLSSLQTLKQSLPQDAGAEQLWYANWLAAVNKNQMVAKKKSFTLFNVREILDKWQVYRVCLGVYMRCALKWLKKKSLVLLKFCVRRILAIILFKRICLACWLALNLTPAHKRMIKQQVARYFPRVYRYLCRMPEPDKSILHNYSLNTQRLYRNIQGFSQKVSEYS